MRARLTDAAGERPCPRCAAVVPSMCSACELCGWAFPTPPTRPPLITDLGDRRVLEADTRSATTTALAEPAVASHLPRPAVAVDLLPVASSPRPSAPRDHRGSSITGLAVAVGVLAVLQAALVSWALPAVTGPETVDVAATVLRLTFLACLTALAIVFLRWVAVTHALVQSRSPVRQRWPRPMAVAGWLLPVVGMLIGWQVLQDLWTASDPATREDVDAPRSEPVLLTCWLGGLAVSTVVWLAGAVVLGGAPFVDMVSGLALAVSGVCLGLVVDQVNCWQQSDPAS